MTSYEAIVLMGPPGWKFDLEVDGEDAGSASVAIGEFLE